MIWTCRVALFVCQSCGHEEWKENDRGRVEEPKKCSREDCGQQWGMQMIHNRCAFYNKQIVKMQVRIIATLKSAQSKPFAFFYLAMALCTNI